MSLKKRLDIAKISYSDIQKSLNKKYDAVVKAVKRESLDSLQLEKISRDFGINSNWLETGEGEMLVSNDKVSEPAAAYGGESGMRLLSLIDGYIPEGMQDVVKKLKDELVDLYEYKELYYKAKEAYRPK